MLPPHRIPKRLRHLLSIEGMRPIGDDPLRELARQIRAAAIYRLRPRAVAPLRAPDEALGAVTALWQALVRIQAEHPAGPLHVVTTAHRVFGKVQRLGPERKR